MRLACDLIDLSRVHEISVGGRGGKEREASLLLSKWRRSNARLYDYEVSYSGDSIRLEVKKQANLQWFDSGKYYRLSDNDRGIRVMFLMHDGGKITAILVALLGELVDWLCEHKAKDGWTEEVLRIGADFKDRYPTLQFKAKAEIGAIFKECPGLFDVLYKA